MARISTGTMTVAIFAVLFGLVGAYALRAALVGDAPPPPAAPRTTAVPLAAHDLPAGRRIVVGDMVLVPMTQADMQARKLPLDKTMLSTDQIIGRVLQEAVKPGEAFLTSNLYPEGTGPKLSDKLKPGMRAVTVPIDNLAAVGGSTVEGSFVDVLFRAKTRAADPMTGRPEIPATTVTLLENVEVLAVDRIEVNRQGNNGNLDIRNTPQIQTSRSGSNYSGNPVVSVTIAVSPDQANVVKAVMGQGDMSLALRSDKGAGTVTPNKYTLEDILGIKHPKIAEMNRIEIFRGGWSRQHVAYQDDKLVRDETSMSPGVSPTTPFPVPAKLPRQPGGDMNSGKTDPTYYPEPQIINTPGGRRGYGGYGGFGYGGYGRDGYGGSNTSYGAGFSGYGG